MQYFLLKKFNWKHSLENTETAICKQVQTYVSGENPVLAPSSTWKVQTRKYTACLTSSWISEVGKRATCCSCRQKHSPVLFPTSSGKPNSTQKEINSLQVHKTCPTLHSSLIKTGWHFTADEYEVMHFKVAWFFRGAEYSHLLLTSMGVASGLHSEKNKTTSICTPYHIPQLQIYLSYVNKTLAEGLMLSSTGQNYWNRIRAIMHFQISSFSAFSIWKENRKAKNSQIPSSSSSASSASIGSYSSWLLSSSVSSSSLESSFLFSSFCNRSS